ncbi:MAG: AAA family ATPase, partial [Desulfobacula sp.]|nr:AAA family ATPase [Desulfobacula sp.]
MQNSYEIVDELYQSQRSKVFRAIRKSDNLPVILKVQSKRLSSEKESILAHEYELGKEFDNRYSVTHLALEHIDQHTVLVSDDDKMAALKSAIPAKGFDIPLFLELAIELTSAIEQVHSKEIIHRDINPSNIIWNTGNNKLKIIDFGIASSHSSEKAAIRKPEQLEGTLAYLSPEQTGRINRTIDKRTDVYSMGVTFYEMISGQLPFTSTDNMELVHCHIAKMPTPVNEINPKVPAVISAIIMKMLSKDSKDRYQSAFGIKADLEECINYYRKTKCLDDFHFKLAQNDFSGRFQISQKLYDRDRELDTLLKAFKRVTGGSAETIIVSGHFGVGKTALVHELHKLITELSGYFITGSFDKSRRNIPFSALSDALNMFCDYMLKEDEQHLEQIRQKIIEAVGNNGQILMNIVPKLEQVIGPQPIIDEIENSDSQRRLILAFKALFMAFRQFKQPLVLFLDDLQWADSTSLHLLKALTMESKSRYFC